MAEDGYKRLVRFPPYRDISIRELDRLWRKTEVWSFQEGSVLAYPGEGPESLWLVESGSLALEPPEEDAGERTYFGPGEFCSPIQGVLKGQSPGVVLRVPEGGQKKPAALTKSSLLRRWGYLFPGETPERAARPSSWFLAARLFPWVFLLASGAGAFLAGLQGSGPGYRFLMFSGLPLVLASLVGLGASAWFWGREIIILTTGSLVHRYFRLTEKKSGVRRIPLSSVQSVTVEKKGILSRLLKIGTLKISTPAMGGDVTFHSLPHPEEWEAAIKTARSQGASSQSTEGKADLRSLLRARLGTEKAPRLVKPADGGTPGKAPGKVWGSWSRDGGAITFRKHPWLLFSRIWWPVLGALSSGFLGGYGFTAGLDPWIVGVPAVLGFTAFGLKAWWEFWDWDNDLYQVNQGGVTDFDRKPLWFGESRKDAPWSAIQGVGVEKSGWLGLILDYGNVKILTGGEDAGMVFEGVKHPELVQTEIFFRRQAYWKSKEAGERTQRLEDAAELLELYDQGKKQGEF